MRIGLVTAVATAIVIGLALNGGGGGGSTANVFVSLAGNDSTCVRSDQTKPCLTWNKAYTVANQGDTVEIAAGSYGFQQINQDTNKPGTTYVTFQPASGATVTADSVYLGYGQLGNKGPSYVVLKGITVVNAVVIWGFSDHITLDTITAKHWNDLGGTNVTVTGSNFGNCTAPTDDANCNIKIDVDANWSPVKVPTNLTITNSTYHDMVSNDLANYHAECMFIRGGTNITIQNNRFYNCHVFDIFVQESADSTASSVTIQNNQFDAPYSNQARTTHDHRAISFGSSSAVWTDWLIRYNSFYDSDVQENDNGTTQSYSNFRIIGNVMKSCTSYPGVTYDYNVYNSATGCGSNKQTSAAWPYLSAANGASGDYHLTGGAGPADGYVTPLTSDYALTTDYDGGARTAGSRDAGADER